jgi:hypothetical protein
MTLPRRLLGVAAVSASAITLAVPAAGATTPKAGEKTFQQTYPLASKVCANVAAGTESKHLKRFATKILADCTLLQSSFTVTQSTVLAARTAITAQIAVDRAAITTACPTTKDKQPVCLQAHASNEPAIGALKRQLRTATRRYYKTIEANRARFWNAFRSLPGEGHVHADLPVPVLPS